MTSTIRLTAILIVAGLLGACSDPETQKKEHFDSAEKFMAAGKVAEAIVEYRNAIRQDSKYGEARLKLAEAYRASGNGSQAFREFIRAADLLPQNSEAQIRAATYLIAAGSFEDAKTRIQAVVDRDPTNAEAQLVLGNALLGLKDPAGAIREIEEAIKLDPQRGYAYSSLAAARLAQGDRDQAKAALLRAVEVEPTSIRARLSLGYFYWATGDTVLAEDTYKSAVAVAPKDSLANRSMAAFYAGTNRASMAEPYLKAVADSGDANAVLQLADYYLVMRRTSEATAILTPLTKDPAKAGLAEVRLATIAYASDKAKGHATVDTVIAREPNNLQARLLKAQWLTDENKAREALAHAESAVKSEPNSAEAHFVLGRVQAQLRMRKEAIVQFGEVLRLNPRATPAQVYLSRLNLIEGSADSAVQFAESALSNAPRNPEARLSLVRGLLGRRDTARAEQELAPLLQAYPKVGALHAVDGGVKIQKKDFVGARAAYMRALELGPKSTEALAGLISIDMFEKKPADARARIERRLGDEPNSVELLLLAGNVYATQRDFPLAESTFRKVIQLDPAASGAYTALAGVLLMSGKLDAARAEFDQIVQRDSTNVSAATMAAMIVDSQGKRPDAKKRYEAIIDKTPAAVVAPTTSPGSIRRTTNGSTTPCASLRARPRDCPTVPRSRTRSA
jgi:tetratricopeptide (TPR) repeat protein